MIEHYLSTFKTGKEKSSLPTSEPYSLQQVLDNLNYRSTSEKYLTICDFKTIINSLKQESKEIKLRLDIVESSPKPAYNSGIIVSNSSKDENHPTLKKGFKSY